MCGPRSSTNSRAVPPLPNGYLPTNPSYQENNLVLPSEEIKKANIAEGNIDMSVAYNGFGILICISSVSLSPPTYQLKNRSLCLSQVLAVVASPGYLRFCYRPLFNLLITTWNQHCGLWTWGKPPCPFLSLYFPGYDHVRLAGCIRLCRGWRKLKEMTPQKERKV